MFLSCLGPQLTRPLPRYATDMAFAPMMNTLVSLQIPWKFPQLKMPRREMSNYTTYMDMHGCKMRNGLVHMVINHSSMTINHKKSLRVSYLRVTFTNGHRSTQSWLGLTIPIFGMDDSKGSQIDSQYHPCGTSRAPNPYPLRATNGKDSI